MCHAQIHKFLIHHTCTYSRTHTAHTHTQNAQTPLTHHAYTHMHFSHDTHTHTNRHTVTHTQTHSHTHTHTHIHTHAHTHTLCFRLLDMRRTSPCASRVVNITHEIWRLADRTLAKTTFVSPGERACVRASVCACVDKCVHACVMCACMRACVHKSGLVWILVAFYCEWVCVPVHV